MMKMHPVWNVKNATARLETNVKSLNTFALKKLRRMRRRKTMTIAALNLLKLQKEIDQCLKAKFPNHMKKMCQQKAKNV